MRNRLEVQQLSDREQYDGIVICSTQNQMVNYLTVLHHFHEVDKKIEIYYITINDKNYSRSNNKSWDDNIKRLLNGVKFKLIEFEEKDISDHASIIDRLRTGDYGDKKLLWNITGGQRHLVMAITEFVYTYRENEDVIVYYEGNQRQFYYYSRSKKVVKPEKLSDLPYEKLNLNIAFELMGFISDDETKKGRYYNYLKSKSVEDYIENEGVHSKSEWKRIESERRFYHHLYQNFVKADNLDLLNMLKETNQKSCTDLKQLAIGILNLEQSEYLVKEDIETFKKSMESRRKTALFGYIFEYIVFYKIIDILKKNEKYIQTIADINLSTKAKLLETNDSKFVDEFDISILTKSGQLIIFECKSGGFTGDNIKSHHYSTYAVSGVYGTPILMIPITKKLIKFNEEKYIKDCDKKINAAKKAKVEFWRMDDLEDNLLNLLKREEKHNV